MYAVKLPCRSSRPVQLRGIGDSIGDPVAESNMKPFEQLRERHLIVHLLPDTVLFVSAQGATSKSCPIEAMDPRMVAHQHAYQGALILHVGDEFGLWVFAVY